VSENRGVMTILETRLGRVFLVFLFFLGFLLLYFYLVSYALRNSADLRKYSSSFIPAYRNFVPGFSLVGFVLPLVVAILVTLALLWRSPPTLSSIAAGVASRKFWLLAALLSIGFWYLAPGFASGGHTDFSFAIITCAYVGWHLDRGSPKRRILLSIVLGFGIGLVSDLQSQTFFVGIFGGWGLLDGDLLGTIALPLSTVTTMAVLRMIPKRSERKSTPIVSAKAG
jgi:hypothetical protein